MKRLLKTITLVLIFSCLVPLLTINAKSLPTYLIISTNGSSSLTELIRYRQNQNLDVLVKDTSDFRENDGKVSSQKILQYLKDNVEKLDIKYLLIVGYDFEIPMVVCHPEGQMSAADYLVATPTDYPYSTPSSNWDKDGDGRLGEWPDDGLCAFEPEISVGRIPFSDPAKVTNACKSIVEFDSLTDSQKSKVLFGGAMLGYKGEVWEEKPMERTDGSDYCEKAWHQNFAGKGFSRYRLYEKEGFIPSPYVCEEPINSSTLLDKTNDRYGLVLWTGHGSSESVVRTIWGGNGTKPVPGKGETTQPKLITANNIQSKTVKWGIVLAASCSTSDPSNTTNLGATFIASGASGYIGSSRVSWSPSYWRRVEDGGMDTILFRFCHFISEPGTSQGMALAMAKKEFGDKYFYGDTEDPVAASQMNLYNFNLFGDPAVKLVSGDDSPKISVDEPSVTAYPGSKTVWTGNVYGKFDEDSKIQVIPAQRDMTWALPALDRKDIAWSIEVSIPAGVEFGKRTWFIKLTQGEKPTFIPIVLNISDPPQSEIPSRVAPDKIGAQTPFVLVFSSDQKLKVYEYTIKYNPFELSVTGIEHIKKPFSKMEIIDNHFGMVFVRGEGTFASGDLFRLKFKASKDFTGEPVFVSTAKLQPENSNNLITYPRFVNLAVDTLASWRLQADFNDSGPVDNTDLAIMIARIFANSGYDKRLDLNNDGVLNLFDISEVKIMYTKPIEP